MFGPGMVQRESSNEAEFEIGSRGGISSLSENEQEARLSMPKLSFSTYFFHAWYMICDLSSRHEDAKDIEEVEGVGWQLRTTTVTFSLMPCLYAEADCVSRVRCENTMHPGLWH